VKTDIEAKPRSLPRELQGMAPRDLIAILTADIAVDFVKEQTGCQGLTYRVTLNPAAVAALRPDRQVAVEVLAMDSYGGYDLHTHHLSSRGGSEVRKAELSGGNYPASSYSAIYFVYADPFGKIDERGDHNNRRQISVGPCLS
jgi:hypothetical protein